jgi:hypothetical protein
MANKTVLKTDSTKESKPAVTQVNNKNITPEKVPTKIKKTPKKKSSALVAASMGGSALDAVKAHSSKDVRGTSGLANTGPFVSYD